jgi:hypothetical protein
MAPLIRPSGTFSRGGEKAIEPKHLHLSSVSLLRKQGPLTVLRLRMPGSLLSQG